MKIVDLIIDPELESFLPPLTAEERTELKSQIERDGFTDPIIVWLNHGIIVDGYNRYRIWQELGSDEDAGPDILEKKFADRMDVMEWMFKRQNGRRNMTPGQRAAVALKMKPAIEERAKESAEKSVGRPSKKSLMNSSTISEKVNSRKEVAKIAGVSEDTVRKTEIAIKEGTPDTVKSLESGAISANAAFRETRKPSHGTKFDPSEWEDGPDRSGKKPKNGAPTHAVFDDKGKFDKPIGQLRRALDERLAAFPGTDKFFRQTKHALGEFQKIALAWREHGKE